MMIVTAWVDARDARAAERVRICECLESQQHLLNFEAELLSRQMSLI